MKVPVCHPPWELPLPSAWLEFPLPVLALTGRVTPECACGGKVTLGVVDGAGGNVDACELSSEAPLPLELELLLEPDFPGETGLPGVECGVVGAQNASTVCLALLAASWRFFIACESALPFGCR